MSTSAERLFSDASWQDAIAYMPSPTVPEQTDQAYRQEIIDRYHFFAGHTNFGIVHLEAGDHLPSTDEHMRLLSVTVQSRYTGSETWVRARLSGLPAAYSKEEDEGIFNERVEEMDTYPLYYGPTVRHIRKIGPDRHAVIEQSRLYLASAATVGVLVGLSSAEVQPTTQAVRPGSERYDVPFTENARPIPAVSPWRRNRAMPNDIAVGQDYFDYYDRTGGETMMRVAGADELWLPEESVRLLVPRQTLPADVPRPRPPID